MKKEKYRYARNAFYAASKTNYDEAIKEDALFSYAKLSYQLEYNPYHEAIGAFQEYIRQYPNTERTDDAYEYLVNVFITTKNYKDALMSLENIKVKEDKLKGAYQKVAYLSASELFNDRKYVSAIRHYDKSLIYPIDRTMKVDAYYWRGEAYYKIKNYDKAIDNYKIFAYEPAAFNLSYFNKVNYNLGYAYFKKKDYKTATVWFRKYVSNKSETDTIKLNDSYIRIGDAFFINKNYYNAIDYYNKAIELKKMDIDYALYQKSMALGVLKKLNNKITTLETLLADYPNSNYAVDAKYSLGKSYMMMDKDNIALTYFNNVVNNYPNSSYVKKSLLNIGQIHFNDNKNEAALQAYKRVIKDYPTYEDSKEALEGIKSIYINIGNVDEYAEYIKDVSFAHVSEAALDSTTYEAAELRYMDGDCEKAKEDFANYLQKFTNGIYTLNATFYMAECEYNMKKYEQALIEYNYVISQPLNKFSESSLAKASAINYHSKKYEDALNNYMMLEKIAEYKSNVLEAQIGQMRCFALVNNNGAAIEYANIVLDAEKVPEDILIEAHLTIGKSAMAIDSLQLAIKELTITHEITKNKMGAEAKYNVAYIYYLQDSLSDAEKLIFNLVTQIPSYDYWIAKGLILLSDIYLKKEDNFQAKQTLQSIIDNYEGPDLVQVAQEKLDTILASEKIEEEEVKEEEKLEIILFDSDELFPEEIIEEE